jgi:hypothetical protein
MDRGELHAAIRGMFGYVRWASFQDHSAEEILATIMHDLGGIAAEAECFAPRTSRYERYAFGEMD